MLPREDRDSPFARLKLVDPFDSSRRSLAGAAALIFALAVLPLVILGERSWVTIHDTLDSQLVWYVNAARAGAGFVLGGHGTLPNVMNGLPRADMTSQINVVSFWFFLLPPFWAFVVNTVVVRGVAFVGSLLLLRRLTGDEPRQRAVSIGLALLFALLPFFTLGGLTAAGIPLLIHAWLDIESDRARPLDWIAVAAFPFYSSLYLVGVFLVGTLGARVAYLAFRRRPAAGRALAAVTVLFCGYLVAEWPTLLPMATGRLPTHRAAQNLSAIATDTSLFATTLDFLDLLANGQGHAGTLRTWPVAISLLLAMPDLLRSPRRRLVISLLVGVVGVSAYASLTPMLVAAAGDRLPILRQFQVSRFYFFLPVMWLSLFAAALDQLTRLPRRAALVPALLVLQLASVGRSNKEIAFNLMKLGGWQHFEPSFGEFYDPELFTQIRSYIRSDPSRYRVAAVGLHPSILQYNGFYTLDSYENLYPLAYKRQFRAIIDGELRRSARLRDYFDAWGNRCYVFSSELGTEFLLRKGSVPDIENLAIDPVAFHRMGGRYLLSTARLLHVAGRPARPLRAFDAPRSYWRIYLYEIEPDSARDLPSIR